MKIQYLAHFDHADDGINVSFPDIPEAITYGFTMDEAIFNAQEVLSLVLEDYIEENKKIPKPSIHKGKNFHWITPDVTVQVPLLIQSYKKDMNITTAQLARVMNSNWAATQRLEKAGNNISIKQLQKAADALGKRVNINFS